MSASAGRDNGLTAAAYVPLVDVSPDVADAALDLLAREGIAACATPADEGTLERIHVDDSAGPRARMLLEDYLSEAAPDATQGRTADEELWAGIVAAFDAPSADDPLRAGRLVRPAREDPPEPPVERTAHIDEHFVPPDPPPPPAGDAVGRWAWIAVLGTPVAFFVLALLGIRPPAWILLGGAGAFVGGFVTLVARMQDRPPGSEDPENGAVI